MDAKQIIKFSVFMICALFTIRAINILPYKHFSALLAIGIISAPLSVVILFNKSYWLRAIIAVLTFSGIFGLSYIGQTYGRNALYGEALTFPQELYLFHGIISASFIILFGIWYLVIGRKENDKNL